MSGTEKPSKPKVIEVTDKKVVFSYKNSYVTFAPKGNPDVKSGFRPQASERISVELVGCKCPDLRNPPDLIEAAVYKKMRNQAKAILRGRRTKAQLKKKQGTARSNQTELKF
ncbi:MAG: hypothetical protein AAB465_03335 [Patescibacteria group bacterium]